MGIEQSHNFKRVSSTITTSGVVGAAGLKGLRSEGYRTLINLLPDDSKYAVARERELVEAQGIRYVHIPVDFANPTIEDLERFVAAMDAVGDGSVHIHCAANYRVSAFYALYAESKRIWSTQQANEFMRSLWNPADHQRWSEFLELVRGRGAGV